MQAQFVHEGQRIDYTPSGAVTAGDVVVQGDLVGVAPRTVAANEPSSLIIDGVFLFAKTTGALTVGAVVYWDDTNNIVSTSSAAGKKIGYVTKAAASGDTTVECRLVPASPAILEGAVDVKTANYTLLTSDANKVIVANGTDLVFTLPATAAGLKYTFFVLTASTTTGLSISPAAADKIMGKGLTAADNKDLINTAATDAVGDVVTLVGDGVDGWYMTNQLGTWAREA